MRSDSRTRDQAADQPPSNIIHDPTIDFSTDCFALTPELERQYESVKAPPEAQIVERHNRLLKNVSLFDVAGRKLWWGDLDAQSIASFQGIYYVLSEGDSFWNVPEHARIEDQAPRPDPFSRSRYPMTQREATRLDMGYVRRAALGRIRDGVFESSSDFWLRVARRRGASRDLEDEINGQRESMLALASDLEAAIPGLRTTVRDPRLLRFLRTQDDDDRQWRIELEGSCDARIEWAKGGPYRVFIGDGAARTTLERAEVVEELRSFLATE